MSQRILTGMQCTSDQFHIGNYFGAAKPMLDLAKKFPDQEVFMFVANLHSFNVIQNGEELRKNAIATMKLYLACGMDPKQFFFYNQADVPAHTQLLRVLMCITHMGFMERMHKYKDLQQKGKASEINLGVFSYPILMAADIFLYDAKRIPLGKDNQQHIEYARDIAIKFNNTYGETFVLPELYLQEENVIPGIDGRKMSKSYNNYIGMMDDEKTLLKKVKQIPTESLGVEEPKNPDTCNVYAILRLFLDEQENQTIRQRYQKGGLSYKEVKEILYEKLITFLTPIQKKYNEIDDSQILSLLAKNAHRANEIANKKIQDVYKKVGFSLG